MNKEILEKLSFLNKMAKVCPDKERVACIYTVKHFILVNLFKTKPEEISKIGFRVLDNGQHLIEFCIGDFTFHIPHSSIPAIKWDPNQEVKWEGLSREIEYDEQLTNLYFKELFDVYYDLNGFLDETPKEHNKLIRWFVKDSMKKEYGTENIELRDRTIGMSPLPLMARTYELIVNEKKESVKTFYKYFIEVIRIKEQERARI